MFRFTQEPSSGSYNQCLAKIKSLVQRCMSVRTLSVLQRHMPHGIFLREPKHVGAAFISLISF